MYSAIINRNKPEKEVKQGRRREGKGIDGSTPYTPKKCTRGRTFCRAEQYLLFKRLGM